jgi:hypothetical protein
MNLEFLQETARFGWRKGLVERRGSVGVEIVHHQHEFFGLGVMDIDSFADEVSPILTGATLGDFDLSPPCQRLTG